MLTFASQWNDMESSLLAMAFIQTLQQQKCAPCRAWISAANNESIANAVGVRDNSFGYMKGQTDDCMIDVA
jgi:hypothetical protein